MQKSVSDLGCFLSSEKCVENLSIKRHYFATLLCFAHRARCAAAILARPSALIVNFRFFAA
jgi:hypothetical protein